MDFEYIGSGKITLVSLFTYDLIYNSIERQDREGVSYFRIIVSPESVYSYYFSRFKTLLNNLFSLPTFSLFNNSIISQGGQYG